MRSASRSGAEPGPLAQAADVAPVGEGEQREDAEAEEGGQAGEGADLFDHLDQSGCERLFVGDDCRGVATRCGDQLHHPLGQISLVAGQNQVFERVQRRLHPLRVDRPARGPRG